VQMNSKKVQTLGQAEKKQNCFGYLSLSSKDWTLRLKCLYSNVENGKNVRKKSKLW
jgi:hypothetical protein